MEIIDRGDHFEVIVKLDVPTKTGLTYPRTVMEQALGKIGPFRTKQGIAGRIGMPTLKNGDDKDIVDQLIVPAESESHRAKDIRILHDEVVARIIPVETGRGRFLQTLMNNDEVAFRMAGLAKRDENGVVTYYTLVSINAVLKENAA